MKNNQIYIEKWIWSKTLSRLYSSDEKERIEGKVNELLSSKLINNMN